MQLQDHIELDTVADGSEIQSNRGRWSTMKNNNIEEMSQETPGTPNRNLDPSVSVYISIQVLNILKISLRGKLLLKLA